MKTRNADNETRRTEPRQARLEALLFAGAVLGTTILTLGATADPKLPPFKGE
jgi:hypothetical protein